MRRYLCLLPAVMFLLSGCGDTRGERTVTGAGIGAGAGAVVGAITGFGAGNGALLGAAVGGVAGMVTDNSDVNLGDPAWKQGKDSQRIESPAAELPDCGAVLDGLRQPGRLDRKYAAGEHRRSRISWAAAIGQGARCRNDPNHPKWAQ